MDSDSSILDYTPRVIILGKEKCKFCDEAKGAFTRAEVPFEYDMLDTRLCLTGTLPDDWRTNGLIDLHTMWAMVNNPVPFIIVDGRGYRCLSEALSAVNYAKRRRAIIERDKKRAKENNPRTNS